MAHGVAAALLAYNPPRPDAQPASLRDIGAMLTCSHTTAARHKVREPNTPRKPRKRDKRTVKKRKRQRIIRRIMRRERGLIAGCRIRAELCESTKSASPQPPSTTTSTKCTGSCGNAQSVPTCALMRPWPSV